MVILSSTKKKKEKKNDFTSKADIYEISNTQLENNTSTNLKELNSIKEN